MLIYWFVRVRDSPSLYSIVALCHGARLHARPYVNQAEPPTSASPASDGLCCFLPGETHCPHATAFIYRLFSSPIGVVQTRHTHVDGAHRTHTPLQRALPFTHHCRRFRACVARRTHLLPPLPPIPPHRLAHAAHCRGLCLTISVHIRGSAETVSFTACHYLFPSIAHASTHHATIPGRRIYQAQAGRIFRTRATHAHNSGGVLTRRVSPTSIADISNLRRRSLNARIQAGLSGRHSPVLLFGFWLLACLSSRKRSVEHSARMRCRTSAAS